LKLPVNQNEGPAVKPIIDIHEHIFRARDIPVKGYLYSRKYEGIPGFLVRFFRLPSLLAFCIRRGQRRGRFGPFASFLIRLASAVGGEDYRTWARVLSLPDVEQVAARLQETFQGDRIDLFVPLMIDYEYWFRNSVDTPLVRQIDDMYRYVVREAAGRIHPFVPFDPVRELAFRRRMPSPDGSRERDGSLDPVKDAVANKGFLGVKIYNSLGYRPWGNDQVDAQRRRLLRRIGMARFTDFTGPQIDGVLDELYSWCEQEQVPITAHCVADGIESYPGASYDFAAPALWIPVLQRHPGLHLNLAHFGWSEAERFTRAGSGGNLPWVRQICEVLSSRECPFVYADVAHHDVFNPRKAAGFLEDYHAILGEYGDAVKEKLLFGIDWHVIARVPGFENFKNEYIRLLKENGLFAATDIAAFLGGNALHFLGLLGTGTPPASGWTKNRRRLGRFYQRNDMTPPRWFTATGP
jgi:predicted TIM-barrel fold metal-dependent hydrolase